MQNMKIYYLELNVFGISKQVIKWQTAEIIARDNFFFEELLKPENELVTRFMSINSLPSSLPLMEAQLPRIIIMYFTTCSFCPHYTEISHHASVWCNFGCSPNGKNVHGQRQLKNHIEHITCSSDSVINVLFYFSQTQSWICIIHIWKTSDFISVNSQQQLQSGKFTTAKSLRKI